jgi:metallo-beta-lactamase class B
MFARVAILALLATAATTATAQLLRLPLGKTPRHIEQPRAPIEVAGPEFDAACDDNDEWDKPAPPVRIHANTYLVGTCGIAAILITGNEGHILIDSGTEAGADLVANNIRQLGFKLGDVRILLHSHEHIDHVGGIGRLQQPTGAQLYASAPAAKVFETGTPGAGDPQAGMHKPFSSARVDHIVADGSVVRLGDLYLTAIATPGHTPGALSWHWGSCDGGNCRRIVYADSLSPVSRDNYRFSDHPAYVAAYRASIEKIRRVECEILLTPHPSASQLIDRMAGRAKLIDPDGCRNYADALTKRLDERLAKEQAK